MENQGKRIVIFGINNKLRQIVEHRISGDCAIVGYADWGKDFDSCRQFAYKPMFSMRELKEKEKEYDYIIVCEADYKVWLKKREKLIKIGCKAEKLLPTVVLVHQNERMFSSTLDDFISMKRNFSSLLFGMSYSRNGFLEHYFTEDWFKFSMNGSDLHTHDSYLTYLLVNCTKQMESVKRIMLDLPYYAFDWDIQSSHQIYGRMVQFDRLSDYGTFLAQKEDAGEYIRQYRVLKELVGDGTEQAEGGYANYFLDNRNLESMMQGAPEEFFVADKVWRTEYEATVRENMQRLTHIRDLCRMYDMELSICVYPMSPVFVEKNRDVYEKKKTRFYRILKELGCDDRIIDLGERIEFQNSDYGDLTHLNTPGGIKCSRELNRILEESKADTAN